MPFTRASYGITLQYLKWDTGNAPSLVAFLSLTQLPAPLRSLLLQNKLTALEYLSKGLLTVKFKSEEVPRIILN